MKGTKQKAAPLGLDLAEFYPQEPVEDQDEVVNYNEDDSPNAYYYKILRQQKETEQANKARIAAEKRKRRKQDMAKKSSNMTANTSCEESKMTFFEATEKMGPTTTDLQGKAI